VRDPSNPSRAFAIIPPATDTAATAAATDGNPSLATVVLPPWEAPIPNENGSDTRRGG